MFTMEILPNTVLRLHVFGRGIEIFFPDSNIKMANLFLVEGKLHRVVSVSSNGTIFVSPVTRPTLLN